MKYLPRDGFEFATTHVLKAVLASELQQALLLPAGSLVLRGFWKPVVTRPQTLVVPANGHMADAGTFFPSFVKFVSTF